MIIAEEHGLVLEYFVLGHMFITNYCKGLRPSFIISVAVVKRSPEKLLLQLVIYC